MARAWTLTIDCADAPLVAAFWKEALGYVDAPVPEGFESWEQWLRHFEVPEDQWDDGAYLVDPDGIGPSLSFLAVPEPKTVKNRLHLDIQVAGRSLPWETRRERVAETVHRLVRAGGTVLREDVVDDRLDHVVMADPEGNEFCVV